MGLSGSYQLRHCVSQSLKYLGAFLSLVYDYSSEGLYVLLEKDCRILCSTPSLPLLLLHALTLSLSLSLSLSQKLTKKKKKKKKYTQRLKRIEWETNLRSLHRFVGSPSCVITVDLFHDYGIDQISKLLLGTRIASGTWEYGTGEGVGWELEGPVCS